MSTHAAAPASLTQADLDRAGPIAAVPWTVDELRRGRVFRAGIVANPRPDARWPWRVVTLDGRPLPKVGLLPDHDRVALAEGDERWVQIVDVTHADRSDRGRVELGLLPDATLLGDDVWAPPGLVERIRALLQRRRNLLLSGPQGCGKTTLVRAIADRMGIEYVFFHCGAVTDVSDFSAQLRLRGTDQGVVTELVPTLLLETLERASANPRQRYLVFLDEFNRCPEEARNALMPALDATRRIWNPIRNQFTQIPDNVLFAAAVNIGRAFSGTWRIDAAQLDRFAPVALQWMPPDREIALLLRRYPRARGAHVRALVRLVTRLREDDDVRSTISVRATEEVADLLQEPFYARMTTRDAMLEVLPGSICGRLDGSIHEPGSEAAQTWEKLRRVIENHDLEEELHAS